MKQLIILPIYLLFASLILLSSCGEPQEVDETVDWKVDIDRIEQHIIELSSDEYLGRFPMTVGEELTLEYLESQLMEMGVSPGNEGSFFQEVPLISVKSESDDEMVIYGAEGELTLRKGSDYVIYSQLSEDEIKVEDAELVFCGYGVVAPEYGWNDFEGIDMEGKIALVLVNDPGFHLGDESELFTGGAMTYYGRWTYKYEEAARQGAEGVIIIHEDAAAGYPWTVVETSWSGTKMQLDLEEGSLERAPLQGWVTTQTAQQMFELADMEKEEMLQSALSPDFTPVPMGLSLSAVMHNTFERGVTNNVVGIIEGSERPDEYIVYTSHWDHLGWDGDDIYNGAVDNATGVAALLEIARAVKEMPEAPARSLVFLFVGAEEQGLLGSLYYANNPIYPTHQTVANLNVDGIYPFGPTNDIIVVGYNQSQLVDWAKNTAEKQGRYVVADREPEKGFFYRSDQFSFAKVGVPAVYAGGGTDLFDGGTERGEELRAEYNRKYYHKPGDEYNPETWDVGGVAQDGEFFLLLGLDLANSDEWPEWNEISEFKAIRESDFRNNR